MYKYIGFKLVNILKQVLQIVVDVLLVEAQLCGEGSGEHSAF